jgi:aerobic-type carbon monoxide dehydrogenase small subunit (CoxS/CutS family)
MVGSCVTTMNIKNVGSCVNVKNQIPEYKITTIDIQEQYAKSSLLLSNP